MTDNDRMDRAKRIREMREGSREEDNDDATDGGEPTDADSEADADEPSEDAVEDADDQTAPTKQTMEDLVESAAEEAEEEPVADEDTETEVEELVSEAISGDGESADEMNEQPDDSGESEQTDTHETEMTSTDQPDTGDAIEEESNDEEGVAAPLPDTDTLEDALDEDEADSEVETAAPEMDEEDVATTSGESEETQEEETRVLEFRLDDEHYCLDIEYIEEIVKEETITRVPNTPEYIQGVVDLRGQITTILNPKVTLGKENTEADQLIVVFDSEAFEDQGHIGWVVDDVRQVSPITDSEVNDPPVEEDYINGVIDREEDDQFVIWTSPELALEEAET